MIKNSQFRWDAQILSLIYVILTASVLYVISSSSGCSPVEDDLGGNSLGEETNMDEVADAYFKVLASKNPLDMRKGQSTLYEGNQRIDLGATLKFYDIDRWVTDTNVEDGILTIDYTYRQISYDQYGSIIDNPGPADDKIRVNLRPKVTEATVQNNKVTPLDRSQESFLAKQLEQIVLSQLHPVEKSHKFQASAQVDPQAVKLTYHSLQVKDRTQKVPSKVSSKPNCGDISNCSLNVRQIDFDVAEWSSSTDWKKTHITWVISADIPAYDEGLFNGFGGFVSQCSTEKIAVTDTDTGKQSEYLVSSCPQVLRDFSWNRSL